MHIYNMHSKQCKYIIYIHTHICIVLYSTLKLQYRKRRQQCATQVRWINHCKMWKHHGQCKRGSHLAVQSPNCRSTVWRSSQSGLRGRNWAPSLCLPFRRLCRMAACGKWRTSSCLKTWKFDWRRCAGTSWKPSGANLQEISRSVSGRWRSLSRSCTTDPNSLSAPGSI